jgi:hypothetical protein
MCEVPVGKILTASTTGKRQTGKCVCLFQKMLIVNNKQHTHADDNGHSQLTRTRYHQTQARPQIWILPGKKAFSITQEETYASNGPP